MGDNDFRFEQIIIEETAYARASDWYNSLHSRLVGPYLTRFGNEEQCARFLPRCVSGECILAIAMTEPGTAIFEIDGGQHYSSNGMRKDAVRDECLRTLGLKVLRFSNLEVLQNIEGVLERIRVELNPP